MWDKDDHLSRWVQGICAVVLCGWILIAIHIHSYLSNDSQFEEQGAVDTSIVAAGVLAVRCFWYAFTGKNNINRDGW